MKSSSVIILLLVSFVRRVEARVKYPLGCFKCSSLNGSDVHCEDPFNPVVGSYDSNCRQGMDGRVGLFPAKFCTKVKGIFRPTGHTMVVRSCGMFAMDNTCGPFEFQGKMYNGCLMSCRDNACNQSNVTFSMTSVILLITFLGSCATFMA